MKRYVIALGLALAVAAWPAPAAEPKKGRDLSNKPDLEMSDFAGADLAGATFEKSNVRLSNFKGAKLAGANFKGANLTAATFTKADLTGADLTGAKGYNASFQEADLSKAILDKMDLSGVSLQKAKLVGASLRDATGVGDVTRADFSGADLRGADLSGASDYGPKSAVFKGAKYDRTTKFPPGVNPDLAGAVLAKDDPPPVVAAKKDPTPDPKMEPKATPKPVAKTDPKTPAKAEPKPVAKADPEAVPAETAYGTQLKFENATLYYTKDVTKAEATALGDYMVKDLGFGAAPMTLQLHKADGRFLVRMVAKKGRELDKDFLSDCKDLAGLVAKNVFPAAKVEVHVCDDDLKTLKVVTPD